jgi:hypothetical protein
MNTENTPKQRHGCLTAWLIMMMIGNAFISLTLLFIDPKLLQQQDSTMTKEKMLLLAILGIINISFAIGLWYWKKWAFHGFALSGVLMFITNVNMGQDVFSSALGLIGILLLYSVLQMKQGDTTGWENLE